MSMGIVFGAALASWVFGAAYYMLLARPWMDASGFSPEKRAALESGEARKNPAPFIISFLSELIMATVLALLLRNIGVAGWMGAIVLATTLWFGLVVTTMATNNAYGMRSLALTIIDAGHWLGVLVIQASVLFLLG